MIDFLTNLSEILKLITLIIIQIGGILILLGIPFIIYYGSQNTEEEDKTIIKITVKDNKSKGIKNERCK